MKKAVLLFWFFLLAGLTLGAQQFDVLDQLGRDPRKVFGEEGPHRFDTLTPLTKAPRGYKAFYMSHYGRHGSRYAWRSQTYVTIHNVLEQAAQAGALTPYGEEFRRKYEFFYQLPLINAGDLTPMGEEQLRRIGAFHAKAFPEIFSRGRCVQALSSISRRCILSMGAYSVGLLSDGKARVNLSLSSTHEGMCIIAPPEAPKSMARHFEGEKAEVALESAYDYMQRLNPYQGVVSRLFTDPSCLGRKKDPFLSELWQLYCGYHNYEPRPLFDDLYTPQELLLAWEADNYYTGRGHITGRYAVIPLLEDILSKADTALQDPSVAAHLRFGHDYILESLLCLLNVNGMGTVPTKAEDTKYWFQSYEVPMAANLALVMYRNKAGDILFKVLLNEQEAVLPQLTPVTGPYYRWQDFENWARELLAAHPEIH